MTRLERFLSNPPRRLSDDAKRIRRTKALRKTIKRLSLLKEKRKEQGNRCHYCKRLMLTKAQVPEERQYVATLDHLTPLAAGGDNSRENLVAACDRCNTEKGHMDADDYLAIWADRHEKRRRQVSGLAA